MELCGVFEHDAGECDEVDIDEGRRRDVEREYVAERIDGQMQLGPLFALGAIVTGAGSALGRGT